MIQFTLNNIHEKKNDIKAGRNTIAISKRRKFSISSFFYHLVAWKYKSKLNHAPTHAEPHAYADGDTHYDVMSAIRVRMCGMLTRRMISNRERCIILRDSPKPCTGFSDSDSRSIDSMERIYPQ